jgi:hypothetical protein
MFGFDPLSVGVGIVVGLVVSWLWTKYGPK